jgi:hypothetical protein
LPTVNSTEVTMPPTHASCHATLASGTVLNITANSAATTPSEITKLMLCQTASPPGSALPKKWPIAPSPAVKIIDTSNKNATPITIANENKRSLITPLMPRPGFGSTSQIVSSADCSSLKTPEAPKSRTTMPAMLLRTPAVGACALRTMVCTASPP